MANIKGVILSIEDVLLQNGRTDWAIFAEVEKLIHYFRKTQIEFCVFTNRPWKFSPSGRRVKDVLIEKWGDFPYFCRDEDPTIPPKPTAASTRYVLAKMGWTDTNAIYVGATESDMRTAVNGNLLFLRATWYANKTDYGFEFATPKSIARFIDVFCVRQSQWSFMVEDDRIRYYALAPFSTMKEEFKAYSLDAKLAAKHGQGHRDFWIGALVSSIYFSGLHKEINLIAGYPGHRAGSSNILADAMSVFGKCFRKKFVPDLIVRHTTATKMQTARNNGIAVGPINQLDTIHLTKLPLKTEYDRFKSSPLGGGKTVLVLDDICTKGYSLEAARTYIEQAGSRSIMVTWLKTINTNIETLAPMPKFDPYRPTRFDQFTTGRIYNYREHFTDCDAPFELNNMLAEYDGWDWPR